MECVHIRTDLICLAFYVRLLNEALPIETNLKYSALHKQAMETILKISAAFFSFTNNNVTVTAFPLSVNCSSAY